MSRILVVDDEKSLRDFLSILLRKHGHTVEAVGGCAEGVEKVGSGQFDLVLSDLRMPDGSGLDVLRAVRERSPATQVIILTAFATTETAVEAMKQGARDYITKPFRNDELLVQVDKALEVQRLERENDHLRRELAGRARLGDIIGRSSAMRQVFDLVQRVAPSRTTVLITGESGTGKELIARAIHSHSERASGPLVTVNCGAIPEALIESELFGYVKGAFTGASSDRKGLFSSSEGGTIFLDEIGELPMAMQVRLLRVLQERRVKRVGGVTEESVDCRVIAATNRDLRAMVAEGKFREDLFYRLNVIQIQVPPLRERREDIAPLIRHFLEKFAREMGRPVPTVAGDAMDILLNYPYHGNVRELENLVERAVTLASGDQITRDSLPPHVNVSGNSIVQWSATMEIPETGLQLETLVEQLERNLLLKALERTGGVRKEASRLLGISFRAMRYRLQKYGLDPGDTDEN